MDQLDLFTVRVFQVHNKGLESVQEVDRNNVTSHYDMKLIDEHSNMISARILKGRTLELEHSKLAGPDVKFKTILNYDRVLELNDSLGISMIPQDGYITKPDINNDPNSVES